MDFGQIVALIFSGGALAGLGAAINGWLKARSDAKIAERKTDSEVDLAQDAQEFNQQAVIISDLRRRIEYLETANADCVKDRTKLHYEVGRLEGRLDEQNASMRHLQHTNTEQSKDAVRLAGEVAAKGVEVAARLVVAENPALSDSAVRLQQQQASKLTERDIPVQNDSIH